MPHRCLLRTSVGERGVADLLRSLEQLRYCNVGGVARCVQLAVLPKWAGNLVGCHGQPAHILLLPIPTLPSEAATADRHGCRAAPLPRCAGTHCTLRCVHGCAITRMPPFVWAATAPKAAGALGGGLISHPTRPPLGSCFRRTPACSTSGGRPVMRKGASCIGAALRANPAPLGSAWPRGDPALRAAGMSATLSGRCACAAHTRCWAARTCCVLAPAASLPVAATAASGMHSAKRAARLAMPPLSLLPLPPPSCRFLQTAKPPTTRTP